MITATTQATTQSTSVTQTTTTATSSTTTTTPTTPGPGQPSIILPDPKITPGVFNPKVKQTTIRKTICKYG
jgi:hypothetical protein